MPLSGSGTASKNTNTPTPECHRKRSGAAAPWPECLFSIHHNRDTCSLVFPLQGALGKRYQLGWSHVRGLMKVGRDLLSLDINHQYKILCPPRAARETQMQMNVDGWLLSSCGKVDVMTCTRNLCKYRSGNLIFVCIPVRQEGHWDSQQCATLGLFTRWCNKFTYAASS